MEFSFKAKKNGNAFQSFLTKAKKKNWGYKRNMGWEEKFSIPTLVRIK
jgi:hypothetical protein